MIPTDCYALRAPAILKHLKSAHFSTKNGYFSVFCGSQSHVLTCKHVIHDLLTLVSSHHMSGATSLSTLPQSIMNGEIFLMSDTEMLVHCRSVS